MTSFNVLLIEDDAIKAKTIIHLLEHHGHKVTQIVGVISTRPSDFHGIAPDGATAVKLDIKQFDVALVDGMLAKTKMRDEQFGWKIVPHLVDRCDLPCVAISTEDTLNTYMIDAGAHSAVIKTEMELAAKLVPAIVQAQASMPRDRRVQD